MFDDAATTQPTSDAGVTSEPAPGGVLGPATDTASTTTAAPATTIEPTATPAADPAAAPVDSSAQFNTTPLSVSSEPVINPPAESPAPAADPIAAPAMESAPSPAPAAGGTDDLLGLKQQALQSLTPILGHLEQSPEEKFKTTMMMIQASDDKSLIKTAYEAAQAITDEKEKAQALLDVVNEINYFTQQGAGPAN